MIELEVHKELQAADGPMQLHIKLELKQGQFATLYGASGAGKTSALRILAGLMQPDSGYIKVHGKTWFNTHDKINLAPRERNIGFVFQDYALFPNMSVYENMRYALGMEGDPGIIDRLMEMIELQGLQSRKPGELSGGQQQRVALARALVQQPEILLLDEPMAALDYKIRLTLQDYLQELHREFGFTTLLISHDLGEILKLSDLVFHLEKGAIIRTGTPEEIFMPKRVSGKFQFTGEVLNIVKQEVVYVVSVLIQNNVVKVVAGEDDIKDLKPGDTVLVASKAFNPILCKLP